MEAADCEDDFGGVEADEVACCFEAEAGVGAGYEDGLTGEGGGGVGVGVPFVEQDAECPVEREIWEGHRGGGWLSKRLDMETLNTDLECWSSRIRLSLVSLARLSMV